MFSLQASVGPGSIVASSRFCKGGQRRRAGHRRLHARRWRSVIRQVVRGPGFARGGPPRRIVRRWRPVQHVVRRAGGRAYTFAGSPSRGTWRHDVPQIRPRWFASHRLRKAQPAKVYPFPPLSPTTPPTRRETPHDEARRARPNKPRSANRPACAGLRPGRARRQHDTKRGSGEQSAADWRTVWPLEQG